MSEIESDLKGSWARWVRRHGVALVAYVLATAFTNSAFMGDSNDYVESVMSFMSGAGHNFWEFGHLYWRPLGWLLSRVLRPVTQAFVGADERAGVMLTFLAVNWVAGLLCALVLNALLRRVCDREWVANVVTVGFIFSNGFLNYAQSGCSYVPGLFFLILGIYILVRDGDRPERSWRTAILAGTSLAVSVCIWFLYGWAIPAALTPAFFLYGNNAAQRRLVVRTALIFAVVGGLSYLAVIAHLGISNWAELKAWIAPHGAPDIKGASRMLFGFARSLINMGNDGAMMKRYLIHDPFNPVTISEIFRVSLWKFVFFYLVLAAVVVELLFSRKGRAVLGLLVVNAIPLIGFALVFLGGDLERYFGIYPV
ncbi:MAG: hypothetical protein ACRD68_04060, partial [Pyrinomonadaceae bacterium]